ncbi:Hypothetical protein HVR_LOCUS543 [uncultured virus]|nr:Hypothetical protein HVR_LOCUS543 [uncultured virus]
MNTSNIMARPHLYIGNTATTPVDEMKIIRSEGAERLFREIITSPIDNIFRTKDTNPPVIEIYCR